MSGPVGPDVTPKLARRARLFKQDYSGNWSFRANSSGFLPNTSESPKSHPHAARGTRTKGAAMRNLNPQTVAPEEAVWSSLKDIDGAPRDENRRTQPLKREGHRELVGAQLRACAHACRLCAEECEKHAPHMKHCAICAEACRRCETACLELLKE
jgi:hypothetical protein